MRSFLASSGLAAASLVLTAGIVAFADPARAVAADAAPHATVAVAVLDRAHDARFAAR